MAASPVPDLDVLIAFADRLADAAGAAIRPYFRQPIDVVSKADASPVTVADRNSERAMRDLIEAHYPDHGIYGEEFGVVRPDADYVWILDPVDGTKSFITGLPIFGTLIALCHRDEPIIGIIDQPILRERWTGASGRATLLNGRPVRVRPCAGFSEAALFTTSNELFSPEETVAFRKVLQQIRVFRLSGDCYAFAMLASGFADLVVESKVQPYDFAALIPVVQGAVGVITDWAGAKLSVRQPSRVLASGDTGLHQKALALLAGC